MEDMKLNTFMFNDLDSAFKRSHIHTFMHQQSNVQNPFESIFNHKHLKWQTMYNTTCDRQSVKTNAIDIAYIFSSET
jgi:hypothetical protein